jgi:uracil-DNA glycosylase
LASEPQEPIDPGATLADLAAAIQHCRRCDLWRDATQAVFGEGAAPEAPLEATDALQPPVVLVGEQPGDAEDRQGHPFVGPAGVMLRSCMAEAGLDEDQVWMTNAVKHFRWKTGTPKQGKRRIHRSPAAEHLRACRPWLDAELERLQPHIVVCLGAVAAQALIGRDFKVSQDRGRIMPGPYGSMLATVHPSSLLRVPDPKARSDARAAFVADLQVVVRHLAGAGTRRRTASHP